MQEYVVGFLFNTDRTQVALIQKNRPKWQAGKFNGIGGHVEKHTPACIVHDPPPCDIGNFEPCNCSGETPGAAMRREFLEETGVLVEGWQKFLSLTYPTARVHFYRAFDDAVYNVETTTDELVALQTLSTRYVPASRAEIVLPINVIPNLAWIIPMALSMETDMATSFDVKAVA